MNSVRTRPVWLESTYSSHPTVVQNIVETLELKSCERARAPGVVLHAARELRGHVTSRRLAAAAVAAVGAEAQQGLWRASENEKILALARGW